MENIITKKELFDTINYVVKMIEKDKDLTLEIKEDYIEIKEINNDTVNRFTYHELEKGQYKETIESE